LAHRGLSSCAMVNYLLHSHYHRKNTSTPKRKINFAGKGEESPQTGVVEDGVAINTPRAAPYGTTDRDNRGDLRQLRPNDGTHGTGSRSITSDTLHSMKRQSANERLSRDENVQRAGVRRPTAEHVPSGQVVRKVSELSAVRILTGDHASQSLTSSDCALSRGTTSESVGSGHSTADRVGGERSGLRRPTADRVDRSGVSGDRGTESATLVKMLSERSGTRHPTGDRATESGTFDRVVSERSGKRHPTGDRVTESSTFDRMVSERSGSRHLTGDRSPESAMLVKVLSERSASRTVIGETASPRETDVEARLTAIRNLRQRSKSVVEAPSAGEPPAEQVADNSTSADQPPAEHVADNAPPRSPRKVPSVLLGMWKVVRTVGVAFG